MWLYSSNCFVIETEFSDADFDNLTVSCRKDQLSAAVRIRVQIAICASILRPA